LKFSSDETLDEIRCDYSKCPASLEFHHTDPTRKDFEISKARFRRFDDRVKDELKSCIMLCSNCHREEHYSYEAE
jgi:hypothetical protein